MPRRVGGGYPRNWVRIGCVGWREMKRTNLVCCWFWWARGSVDALGAVLVVVSFVARVEEGKKRDRGLEKVETIRDATVIDSARLVRRGHFNASGLYLRPNPFLFKASA